MTQGQSWRPSFSLSPFSLRQPTQSQSSVQSFTTPQQQENGGKRTQAVHACTQYAFDIPSTKSLSSISTKNIGLELPAHMNTASGASPPYGSHTASSAAVASDPDANAYEYTWNFCAGDTRSFYAQVYVNKLQQTRQLQAPTSSDSSASSSFF
jgi:hypothetical protein